MKKKMVSMIFVSVLFCIMLVGCGHEHEWKEATCTEARTCAACGEVEGEALGHTWAEATCTEPKICNVCGLTEGKAIGHTLTEANYQQSATCSVCGETEGETLTPFFVENAIPGQFIEVGKEYDYMTPCYDDESQKTVGKFSVTNYQTITSDDMHEEKEGYEWKIADIRIVFSDDNAIAYGMQVKSHTSDYYINAEKEYNWQKQEEGVSTFTVNWNGQDYKECRKMDKSELSDWVGDTRTYTICTAFLVPVGYDGCIATYYDFDGKTVELDDNGVIAYPNENILHFRFQ